MKKSLVCPNEETEPPERGPLQSSGMADRSNPWASIDTGLSEEELPPLSPGPRYPRYPSQAQRLNFQSNAFRKRHFPGVTYNEWQDWRWQLRNSIRDEDSLERVIRLSPDERSALERSGGALPFRVTPYYLSLLDPDDPAQPVRRTVVPVRQEQLRAPCEADDPLGEDSDSPVPGIVHRYPDRVLFLVTDHCAMYCRYCTRTRMVGRGEAAGTHRNTWEAALSYIESNTSVRDVLLSGGDPLTLPDEALEWLLVRLSRVPHVEMVRIGTKVPVVLPQRITSGLTRMLKRFHPLWMSIHFTHPAELTPEVHRACGRLADAGIPLGSQTVLLAGVNDDVPTMTSLVHGLVRMRVRPYYLYQCDPIPGSSHFRTPVTKGIEIIQGLRGHTTGYAVPSYVIDAPAGGGKIPLLPEYVVGREGKNVVLRNYRGNTYTYPDEI